MNEKKLRCHLFFQNFFVTLYLRLETALCKLCIVRITLHLAPCILYLWSGCFAFRPKSSWRTKGLIGFPVWWWNKTAASVQVYAALQQWVGDVKKKRKTIWKRTKEKMSLRPTKRSTRLGWHSRDWRGASSLTTQLWCSNDEIPVRYKYLCLCSIWSGFAEQRCKVNTWRLWFCAVHKCRICPWADCSIQEQGLGSKLWKTAEQMVDAIENEFYLTVLPIKKEHMQTFAKLRINDKQGHKDPSDHVIIA